MRWLNNNLESFPDIEIQKVDNTFRFKGMHPDIKFSVGLIDIDAVFYHEGKCWDLILVADLPEIEKADAGFFCEVCFSQNGKKEIYNSIDDLLEDHTIRPLRRWLERNLRSDKRILFLSAPGITAVKLCSEGEVKKRIDRITKKGSEWQFFVKPMMLEK